MERPIEPLCPQNYFGRGVNYQLPQTEAAIQWFDEQWTAWEAAHPDDVSGEIAYAAFVEQQRLWATERLTNPAHPVEEKTAGRPLTEPVEIAVNCDVGDYLLSHSDYVEQEKHAVSVSAPPAGHAILPFSGRAEKHQVRLTIDKKIYNEFYRHCQRRGTTMSWTVQQFMVEMIELLTHK